VTVFVTTHFLEEVDHCDHVSFIADGRLVADATPEALRGAWSEGYRIALDRAPDADALGRLAQAGFAIERAEGDVALRRATLDAGALAALHAALGAEAAGGLSIEEPPMNEVFRSIIRSIAS